MLFLDNDFYSVMSYIYESDHRDEECDDDYDGDDKSE